MNLPLSFCRTVRCALLVVFALSGTICERAMSQTSDPFYRNSRYTNTISATGLTDNQNISISLPPILGIPNKVNAAVVNLKLDLGADQPFGDLAFQATVTFRLEAVKGNSTLPMCVQNCQLEINRTTPEGLYYQHFKDLSNGIETFAANADIIDGFRVTIDKVVVQVNPVSVSGTSVESTLASSIANSLRLTLDYTIDYGVKVAGVTLNALYASRMDTSKVVLFGWQPTDAHVPDYQFQLLRLYNLEIPEGDQTLSGQIKREEAIITEADWSKALTIETESSLPELKMTMAEGTGYYAWRIRPLGTYEKGGVANAANYGDWSGASLTGKTTLYQASLPIGIFYFRDTDEGKNTIYSRTFTEGNRVSEKITYATSLQQVKQTQTYLPSRKTRVLSQTVYDHSNRPALNTLPVPVDDTTGLRGYQPLLVKPQGGTGPYRAANFDGDSNFRSPSPVQQNTPGFDYYTGKNNVPSAQGYPFTRSLYYNDGTNRAQEQSGVGRTHMIGDSTGMGRTIKAYYSTASEPELIRLFGSEAPVAASVIKTSTVDQNNTTSITYTSKEGKVIATALAFQDQNAALLPLEDAPEDVRIKDVIPSQTQNSKGFLGSKRLSLIERTPLEMAYKMDTCNSVTGDCVTTKLDCAYDLWVVVSKLDGKPFSTQPGSSNRVEFGSNGKNWTFLPSSIAQMQDSTVVYSRDTTVSCTKNAAIQFSTLTVPAGTYLIEKKLLPRGQHIIVEAAQDQLDAQTKPLLNLIAGWSSQIQCSRDVESFYARLRQLARDLDSVNTLCVSSPTNCQQYFKALDLRYKNLGLTYSDTAFFNANHKIALEPKTGNPLFVYLSAACCQNIQIPLTFSVPIFDFKDIALRDQNADGIKVNPFNFLDGRKTEFFPDFEGFAYGYFWDCTPKGPALLESVSALGAMPLYTYQGDTSVFYANKTLTAYQKDTMLLEARNKIKYIYYKFLKGNMTGWETPGTFNLMVYHMLKDEYAADGKDANGAVVAERPAAKPDECSGVTSSACLTGTCVQYNGEEVFNCWINQLVYLRDRSGLCPNPSGASLSDADGSGPPYKVSDSTDKENNDGGKKHDDHFNNNAKGKGLLGWFIKRKVKKLAKRVRNMQLNPLPAGDDDGGDLDGEKSITVDFNYHVVEQFLGCTGYRFAKILTDAPTSAESAPLENDKVNGFLYQVPALTETATQTKPTYEGKNRGYRPNGGWLVTAGTGERTDTLFKSVKDPVYAFKYFEYVDWSLPEVELTTCYNDPNYYIAADGTTKIYLCPNSADKRCNFCGIGRIKCDLTHESWTAGQRNTFFTTINHYRKPSPTDWRNKGLKPGDFASPGYVEEDTFYVWSESVNKTYTAGNYTSASGELKLTAPDRVKAKVEIDLSDLNTGLINTCEAKRPAYKQALTDTLIARCYVIGGCKTATDDNVVPLEDLDFMVDAMVNECKYRGVTTTFRTTTDSCRYLFAPRSKPGHVDTLGVRIEYSEVTYGVGSQDDLNCHQALLLYRPSISSDPARFATPDTLRATASYDSAPLVVRECSGNTLSYQEYIRRKEVTEMNLSISLPSKCSGAPAFVCAPVGRNSYADPTVLENSLPNTSNVSNPTSSGPPRRSDNVNLTVEVSKENQVKVRKPQP